jgi:hypothetical protein
MSGTSLREPLRKQAFRVTPSKGEQWRARRFQRLLISRLKIRFLPRSPVTSIPYSRLNRVGTKSLSAGSVPASRNSGRGASAPERVGVRVNRPAVRIGEIGVIEYVKEFDADRTTAEHRLDQQPCIV